jgi:hypothetical protein
VKPGVIRKHKGMYVNYAKYGVKIFVFLETYEKNFISLIISMLKYMKLYYDLANEMKVAKLFE